MHIHSEQCLLFLHSGGIAVGLVIYTSILTCTAFSRRGKVLAGGGQHFEGAVSTLLTVAVSVLSLFLVISLHKNHCCAVIGGLNYIYMSRSRIDVVCHVGVGSLRIRYMGGEIQ